MEGAKRVRHTEGAAGGPSLRAGGVIRKETLRAEQGAGM
jgi:hypothetical protein